MQNLVNVVELLKKKKFLLAMAALVVVVVTLVLVKFRGAKSAETVSED